MCVGEEQEQYCAVCKEDTTQVCDIHYAHETAQDTYYIRCEKCNNCSSGYLVSSIGSWHIDVWDDPIEKD